MRRQKNLDKGEKSRQRVRKLRRTVFPKQRKIPKGAVLANAKEAIKSQDEGKRLNKALNFDQNVFLSAEYKETAKNLFESFQFKGYKKKQKLLDFEILIANLLKKKSRPLIFSFNRNDWQRNPKYQKTSYFIIEIAKEMEENGLIQVKKGYHYEEGSRKARIWPTNLLLDYFPEVPNGISYKPVQLVELKDENKNLIDYKETQETRRIRSILQKVNMVNEKARIEYKEHRVLAYLYAVFYKKFTLYGRLHTSGIRHYQGLAENERNEITINGDPVVELDYSGLHPRLLYAKEGIQFNDDPYSMVVESDYKPIRTFLKKALLSLLNSGGKYVPNNRKNPTKWFWMNAFNIAQAGINQRLWSNEFINTNLRLQELGITKASQIIERFIEAHKPIAHYFCNGKETGLRIMNRDSKIALDIVNYFAKKGIPILAVHDSFIVQAKYKDELYQVMDKVYQKHSSGFTCPIK